MFGGLGRIFGRLGIPASTAGASGGAAPSTAGQIITTFPLLTKAS
jgi:hypothetical protein